MNGKPKRIRTDNGPEFISKELEAWCTANDVEHVFTQPGCPTQNSYVERFNGSYRRGVLDAYLFRTLQDVRDITEKWQLDYNTTRPHEALENMTPMEFYEMKMKSSLVGAGAPAPCREALPERDFS